MLFTLPIARFDARKRLHKDVADAAAEAEKVAAGAVLKEGAYFTAARKAIRAALAEDGVDSRIDALVERLLA